MFGASTLSLVATAVNGTVHHNKPNNLLAVSYPALQHIVPTSTSAATLFQLQLASITAHVACHTSPVCSVMTSALHSQSSQISRANLHLKLLTQSLQAGIARHN